MSRTGFYLLFIPGLALLTIGVSFTAAAFAMTQGELQPSTRRGLLSLTVVLVVVALPFLSANGFDHLALPRGG